MASALPSSTSTARRSWPYSPRTARAELRQLDQEVQDPGELGRAEVVVADEGDAGQAGPAGDGHALVVVQQRVGLGFPGRGAEGGAGDQVSHQLLAHHVLPVRERGVYVYRGRTASGRRRRSERWPTGPGRNRHSRRAVRATGG